MLKKILIALSLSAAMACGGSKPPADPPIAQDKPVAPQVAQQADPGPVVQPTVLSTTLKPYTNSKKEWSISLPDNMEVVAQEDDKIVVKAEDGSVMGFVRADGAIDTDTLAAGVVYAGTQKGETPAGAKDVKVGEWEAKMVLFHTLGAPDVKAFTVFGSGTHGFLYMYMGYANRDRFKAYMNSMSTITISDKPVKTAPVADPSRNKAPAKKTH